MIRFALWLLRSALKSKYFYVYRDAGTGHYLSEAEAKKRDPRTWIRSRHLRTAK